MVQAVPLQLTLELVGSVASGTICAQLVGAHNAVRQVGSTNHANETLWLNPKLGMATRTLMKWVWRCNRCGLTVISLILTSGQLPNPVTHDDGDVIC